MKWLAALLLAALACAQQSPPSRPEVTGTVLEPGSNQPVVDARVTVYLVPDPPPRIAMAGQQEVYLTTRSDINGKFSFQVERYGTVRIRVEKEGLAGATPMLRPPTDQASVTLDKDHPTREVNFQLGRPGEITGRVIDEETKKPLAKIKVAAWQVMYLAGRRRPIPSPGSIAETSADGTFRIGNLQPTQYLIQLNPNNREEGRILPDFTKEDFELIEEDWARTWWPGGSDADAATPLPVASGQSVNVGTLTARKGNLYRARVSVDASSCAPGELLRVFIVLRNGRATNSWELGTPPCGREFLITRLQPGPLWLEIRTEKRPLQSRERALVALDFVRDNLTVKTALARGIDIEGALTAAAGATKPDFKSLAFDLDPIGGIRNFDEIPGPPDAKGAFRFVNVELRDFRFKIGNLPKTHYVKEIRYNGARAPDGVISLSAGALSQKIEVEIDDKPGTIAGTVKDGDKSVADAHVVLVRQPMNPIDNALSTTTVSADLDGKFQLTGLAPADYLYFAIPGALKDKLQEPYVFDNLLQSAKKVTLGPAALQTLEIQVR